MFEQGPTGRNGRLAGLGDTASGIDLTSLYPIPIDSTSYAYNGAYYWNDGTLIGSYSNPTSPTSSSGMFNSSTLYWLGGAILLGALLFRR